MKTPPPIKGPEHLDCPLHKKPMAEVCHKCALWTYSQTENRQTKEKFDHWNCALQMTPVLIIDLLRVWSSPPPA